MKPVDPMQTTVPNTLGGAPSEASTRADDGGIGVGDTLGRYRLTARIGHGGMGVVFAAHDPELDRTVAVKLLRAGTAQAPAQELRLRREGQVMARLSHPNVIRVYDVGVTAGRVFVAMEFVDGGTLGEWLVATPRSLEDILDHFIKAGRGLAASHETGLVHRDFKPSNVLVGRDGRVLVTDFGLARPSADGDELRPEPISGAAVLRTVTRAGGLVGTPAFMSPEQHHGRTVDARADQFSFCVALWQALYRAAPFAGDSWEELSASTTRGQVQAPPAGANVPAHVHAALLRGLQPEASARFASMHQLLAALEHDPRRVRRRRLRTAALLVGVLGAGFAAAWMLARGEAAQAACPSAAPRLQPVWNDARRSAMNAAFVATDKPFAQSSYTAVTKALDAYAGSWATLHTEVCRATRVRHEQSEDALDLRMDCLGRQLQELDARVELFVHADAKVVERALQVVAGLPGLDGCSDLAALRAPVRPPADPAVRAQVEEIRGLVARAHVLKTAGKYEDGLALALPLLARTHSLGYRPLEAAALGVVGELQYRHGEHKAAAVNLVDATIAARAGRDAVVETNTLAVLVWLGGESGRYQEAHEWGRRGLAAFEATDGSNQRGLGYLLLGLGTLAAIEGKLDEALVYDQRALAIYEKAGTSSLDTGNALEAVARVYGDMGKYDETERYIRRALAIYRQTVGPEHPYVASALFNLAFAMGGQGRFDEAVEGYRQTVAMWERTLGPEHPRLSIPLTNIGANLMEEGKLDEALPYLQRALAIAEKNKGPEHPDVALALLNVGDLRRLQGHADEAMTKYGRAVAIYEKAFGTQYPYLAFALTGMGQVELGRGSPARALPLLERALKIRELQSGDTSALADTRFTLARALWAAGGDRKRAKDLAMKAREGFAATPQRSKKALAEVDAWLEERAGR